MLTLASLGDEVIVPEPYYVTYDGVIAATGATLMPVRLTPETGFHLSAGALERAITPKSRVLLLNSPSNPTGAVLSREEILAIGDVCRRNDLWIVSDEVYAALVFGNRRFASPFDEPPLAERTVVVSSLSKSHAMTGYRAGWAVGPAEFSARMQAISEVMLFGTQPFIQDAAAFALGGEFPEVEAMRRAYESRARLIVSMLENHKGIRVRMPEGGMFVFADIRPTGLSGEAFALALLEEADVAVMPGRSVRPLRCRPYPAGPDGRRGHACRGHAPHRRLRRAPQPLNQAAARALARRRQRLLAFRDIGIERAGDGGIERRRRELLERLLPDLAGALDRRRRAGLAPGSRSSASSTPAAGRRPSRSALSVCAEPKKCPPGGTSAMVASTCRDLARRSTSIGLTISAIICIISTSTTIFSKEAVSPPSIHPAP